MGRKRHASEYLADSGSVSSASTSKMPSGRERQHKERRERRRKGERERELKGRAVARAESVEGWLLLRLIQSTATLPVGRRSFRRISTRWWTEIVKQKSKKRKREENKTEQRERETNEIGNSIRQSKNIRRVARS